MLAACQAAHASAAEARTAMMTRFVFIDEDLIRNPDASGFCTYLTKNQPSKKEGWLIQISYRFI